MRPTSLFTGMGCLLLLFLNLGHPALLSGCAKPPRELPERITIFFSNDAEAELYRCCSRNQVGGISRRASVIAAKDPSTSLVVDAGNFSAHRPGNTYDEFKLGYLLHAYELMGYSVLNAGPLEVDRGEALLKSLAMKSGDRMISANVADAAGELVLPPYKIVEVEGLKVGIVGLAAARKGKYQHQPPAPADPLQMLDPLTSLQSVWPALSKASDIQVLLSQLYDPENSAVIAEFPGLDVIIGGPEWQQGKQMQPWEERGVVIGKTGTRGKFEGEMTLSIARSKQDEISIGHFEGIVTELNDSIPNTPAIEDLLDEMALHLRNGEVIQDIYEPHTEDRQFGYAGSIYCRTCHYEIFAGWLKTGHAIAFGSLVEIGEQNNPGCLECHTVGYAEPGGYAAKDNTYMLANVQCESCHGPGDAHMQVARTTLDQGQPIQPNWKIATVRTPESTCITCHDPDNDPHWRDGVWPYDKLVAQIGCSHWLKANETPAHKAP